MPDPEQTAELIASCLRGDDIARATFLLEFAGVVRQAVARKLAAMAGAPALRVEVDDLCNDVLAKLLADDCRVLRTLRDPRRIRAWLVVVAQRHCMDHLRGAAVRAQAERALWQEEHAGQAAGDSPADIAARGESARRARRLLENLAAPERLAVDLYFFHGCSYAEIAAMTGASINTVAARLHRAKAKLRKAWEQDDVALR
jgi:RNA polymerase sigma factor (sigma-70 family)